MGLKQSDLCAEEPRFSYLGPWHANLIHIDRRKCVLFINDKTLFNFIVPDVARAQIRELDKLFMSYLSCVLADAGVAEADRAGYFQSTTRWDSPIPTARACSVR